MASLVNFFLIIFIVASNCSVRVDALLKKYVSFISDVHKYYGTSSVFLVFSHNDRRLQEQAFGNSLCREFSRKGILTLTINFRNLRTTTNFYHHRIVRPLVTIAMKSVNDITEFNESLQDMRGTYPIWLLIFTDEESTEFCKYCNNPLGNIFHLQFNSEMLVVCCNDPTLREWWSVYENRTETADFATWSENEGFKSLVVNGLYDRRHNVHGAGLRVAIVTKSNLVQDDGEKIGGFGGSVLHELKHVMNFTITETLRETSFGSWSKVTKSWSGVIGKIAEGNADLGVAEFTITNHRRDVVDFTLPLIISRNRLYVKLPDGSGVRWHSYVEVFRIEIWITLILLVITTPILLTAIQVMRSSNSLSCTITENYLRVWGIFCQAGISHFPVEAPLRIAYISLFVSAVVISASYSASLISFLTVSTVGLPFSTMTGFADDKSYKLIVFQNSSNYDLFATSNDTVLKKMMKLMKPWKDLPQTLEEGFEQVCNEKVGFFTDEVVKKTMADGINCKLAEISSGRADNLAMIMSPQSQYTRLVNYHIQRLQSNGILNRFKLKYFVQSNTATKTHQVVGIWNIVPLLSVLGVGIILAIAMLFIEKIYCIPQSCKSRSNHRITE